MNKILLEMLDALIDHIELKEGIHESQQVTYKSDEFELKLTLDVKVNGSGKDEWIYKVIPRNELW